MISIIIPTKNDFDLDKTLISIEKNKKPEKTEIIVVDASEGNLDYIKKRFPKVRWIYFHNKTNKKRTFVEQLNIGTKKAKGNVLVFVDGGCIVKEDWLYELTKPILKENEEFVLGLVKPIGKSHHNWDKKTKYIESCGTASTAIKKDVAVKIGERDTNFSFGSDIDFSWRARSLGYKIRYVPNAVMYHDWGNWKNDIKRALRYGEARVKLYKKHTYKIKSLFKSEEFFVLYYALFFLYVTSSIILTFFWLYYPIFILIPIIRNIKNHPIRKLFFDFFFGAGILKELVFPSKINNNHDSQK